MNAWSQNILAAKYLHKWYCNLNESTLIVMKIGGGWVGGGCWAFGVFNPSLLNICPVFYNPAPC